MKEILFLIRLPFFFLGLVLLSGVHLIIGVPLMLVSLLLLLIVFPFAYLVKLLEAAWKNDARVVSKFPSEWFWEWQDVLKDGLKKYSDLVRWLIEGSKT